MSHAQYFNKPVVIPVLGHSKLLVKEPQTKNYSQKQLTKL